MCVCVSDWGYPPIWQLPPQGKGKVRVRTTFFPWHLEVLPDKDASCSTEQRRVDIKRNLRMNYLRSFSCSSTGICVFVHQADQILNHCSYESVLLSKVPRSAGQA